MISNLFAEDSTHEATLEQSPKGFHLASHDTALLVCMAATPAAVAEGPHASPALTVILDPAFQAFCIVAIHLKRGWAKCI